MNKIICRTFLRPRFLRVNSVYFCKKADNQLEEPQSKFKMPSEPYVPPQPKVDRETIDSETLLLLERLSLVNIENQEALKTLEDAIEFGSRILHINTDGVQPMYTVLEELDLPLREDTADDECSQESILSNAFISEEGYFVAPPGNVPLQQDDERFGEGRKSK